MVIWPTIFFLFLGHATVLSQEVRSGVYGGNRLDSLPIPTSGYQVYIVGELHGIKENVDSQLAYLAMLVDRAGLRDIAIEEKSFYERDAQAYIDGDSPILDSALCLRANLLQEIRRLNSRLDPSSRIRIHLIDIDSPAIAIREHLSLLARQIPTGTHVIVPASADIREQGLDCVRALKKMTADPRIQSELRTVSASILALQHGFEIGTGSFEGSSYLEEREDSMTQNVEEQVRLNANRSVLVICGFDHASRRERQDGGPNRNQPFWPMAARLEKSGLRIFTLITFPLSGKSFWRGRPDEMLWQASDGHLSSGETLDRVIAAANEDRYLYIDAQKEHVRLPSQDVSNYGADGFLLFAVGHPMTDHCGSSEAHKAR